MYIMQLTHITNIEVKHSDTSTIENILGKEMPKEKISQDDKKNFKTSGVTKDQLKNIDQIKSITKNEPVNKLENPESLKIYSFEDLIKLAEKYKEIELKYDLERNVKLVKFEEGKIDISFNEDLNKNFIKKLSQSLYEWTKKRWIITLSKAENLKTFHQEKLDKKDEILSREKESQTFKEILKTFPDARLIDARNEDE